jgi:phytoene dehydrogenase-like protein
MRRCDAVVVGAGHNGLTAASYLARAGRDVLVLERRDTVGGLASTYEFAPGFRASVGPDLCGLLLPEVVADLELTRHGLDLLPVEPEAFAPAPGGGGLSLFRDTARSAEEIRRLSPQDAEAWPRFHALVEGLGSFLRPVFSGLVPTPGRIDGVSELLSLARLGVGLRRLGARPMHELLRVLPMSLADFLGEWFENESLKACLAAPALEGVSLGPRSAGTAALFLYHRQREAKLPRGGAGAVTKALASALAAGGGTIRTGAAVERLLVEEGRAVGVVLQGGEEVRARAVLSGLSPRATFRGLLDPTELPPAFLAETDAIRYRGVTAKLNLAVSSLPEWGGAAVVHVGSDLDTLERAYDATKYGRVSERPLLRVVIPSRIDPTLAPAGRHVVSVTMQYAPFGRGDRETIERRILETLEEVAPGLRGSVLHGHLWTPEDYQRELGLTEGSWHQGEMALDQMLFMRPVPGWARHRTPIRGLYLCGPATHPGGGITGACGRNAARQVLADGASTA